MGNKMGNVLKQLHSYFFPEKKYGVLMVGLLGAGKSTISCHLTGRDVTDWTINLPLALKGMEYENLIFQGWDLGGERSMDRLQPIWRQFYVDKRALVFVVDSSDYETISDAKCALEKMLHELRDVVLLVLATKQDLTGVMGVDELAQELGLPDLKDREWFVQGVSGGVGVVEGFKWISDKMMR